MDTTQKNREEAAQRRPRQDKAQEAGKATGTQKTTRRESRQVEAPASAQQNNGAVRTAQEQRRRSAERPSAERQAQPETPRRKREEESRNREETTGKKTDRKTKRAPDQKQQLARKQAAPKKKRPARQEDPEDISNRKRAYGRSKPKKKSAVAVMGSALKETARKTSERKAQENRKKRPKRPTPAVIYTQPQAFNRNRFLVQLITVTAIVLAMVMGVSIFFRVENVTVSGAEVYSNWSIKEASGIEKGDGLLTFSRARAGALIQANLPYVKSVRFGIKLPDTVNIIVEEEDVVYAIRDQNGTWWLMTSDGRVVEQTSGAKAANYTQVLGVTLESPEANQQAVATEVTPAGTDTEETVATVLVTGAQRLSVARQILKQLENNDIVGEAASVDVTRLDDIILWYGTRYQVNLGDSSRLEYKIACMDDVIMQMSTYQSGILDISFTIWPTQVGYTPFT